jgi:acyl-CoA synthetase (AMP-forming)/AMP-acid ligase II
MNIVSLLEIVASVDPDRVALGDRRSGLTYAQLSDRVAGAAAALADRPGRPVLYAGTASPAFPLALFAAAVAGRPFAPISYRLARAPFEALVADQAPALLIADERTLRGVAVPAGVEVIETAAYASVVTGRAAI